MRVDASQGRSLLAPKNQLGTPGLQGAGHLTAVRFPLQGVFDGDLSNDVGVSHDGAFRDAIEKSKVCGPHRAEAVLLYVYRAMSC